MRSRLTSLLFVVCFVATTAWADSQARIVRLSYLEGDVQLDRGDGSGYIRAFLNMPLIEGTSVVTTDTGRAEIEFEDGSTIRLVPNTTLLFTGLRLRDEGSKLTVVDLREGTAYFDVRQRDEDHFRIVAASREIALDKTSEFRVTHASNQALRIAVEKGELRFADLDGQRTSIRKNESLTLDFADAGRYFLARGIAAGPHDYWDRERDRDRQAENVHYARASNTTVIYLSDLHRHGSFFTVAGYGLLWRPHTFGIPWDPFDSGSWVYYPGHGFVYVSDYAWGWAPFRYGSWVHIRSRGWCWRPGNGYNQWTPGPVIVNAPGGYVQPVVPVAPGDPHDRRGNFGVVRVGRKVDPNDRDDILSKYGVRDARGGSRGDVVGGSAGGSSPILVQDRVRGMREVVRVMPTDLVTPGTSGTAVPIRTEGERRVSRGSLEGTSSGTPATGGTITPPRDSGSDPTVKTGERRTRGEGYIGTQRTGDTPVVTPVAPANPAPTMSDRPVRSPRTEAPVSPAPTPTPTMSDRPTRSPRTEAPPPPAPVIMERPSRSSRTEAPMPQPQPQRMAPPPPAPPPQRAPDRVSTPPEKSQPRLKDQ